MTISVAIISKSEDIDQITLKSVNFADEIIIVLDGKSDKKPFARGKIKYYFRPLNGDFASQRNYAISKATSVWILFVDSDEYVSSELALEIFTAIKDRHIKGYFIPRIDVVHHNPLRHGETGNTKILRLAQKSCGGFSRSVHEVWKVTGKVGILHSPIYHSKDRFVSEFTSRISQYGPTDARELVSEHKPFSYFKLFVYPKMKFINNYFVRLGFLDGTPGLFLAYLLSIQSLSVRIFQWTERR